MELDHMGSTTRLLYFSIDISNKFKLDTWLYLVARHAEKVFDSYRIDGH